MFYRFLVFSLFSNLALANDCSQVLSQLSSQFFDTRQMVLIPGAGARGQSLHLGHLWMGKYFSDMPGVLPISEFPPLIIQADKKGNDSIAERVEKLKKILNHPTYQNRRLILLGHSLGGIVAIKAAGDPKIAERVDLIITAATPFRGTVLVDWLNEHPGIEWPLRKLAATFGYNPKKKRYFQELSSVSLDQYAHQFDENKIIHVVTGMEKRSLVKSLPAFEITARVIAEQIKVMDRETGEWGARSDGIIPSYAQMIGDCYYQAELHHGGIIGKASGSGQKKRFRGFWKQFFKRLKKNES